MKLLKEFLRKFKDKKTYRPPSCDISKLYPLRKEVLYMISQRLGESTRIALNSGDVNDLNRAIGVRETYDSIDKYFCDLQRSIENNKK